ncbi:MAG: hypothetical protein M1837_004604 [Sclerophora amabilis]|nr:MAG: hypothetical protein M1837_004604 [Sclerophora amabilis]
MTEMVDEGPNLNPFRIRTVSAASSSSFLRPGTLENSASSGAQRTYHFLVRLRCSLASAQIALRPSRRKDPSGLTPTLGLSTTAFATLHLHKIFSSSSTPFQVIVETMNDGAMDATMVDLTFDRDMEELARDLDLSNSFPSGVGAATHPLPYRNAGYGDHARHGNSSMHSTAAASSSSRPFSTPGTAGADLSMTLTGNGMDAVHPTPSWSDANRPVANALASPLALEALTEGASLLPGSPPTPPSVRDDQVLASSSANPLDSGTVKPRLHLCPLPLKTRVEREVTVVMTLERVPAGVKSLHLPPHTIQKPKDWAKPSPPPRSPELLELSSMLVCASAIQSPEKLEQAFARARGDRPVGTEGADGASPGVDEPKICQVCVTREEKRFKRKRQTDNAEAQRWTDYAPERIVIFNSPEVINWQPATRALRSELHADERPPSELEGARQIALPMRFGCYCRHQQEKMGFRVIITIKDWEDRVVAQAISSSMLVTDDHKTPAAATGSATTAGAAAAAAPEPDFSGPPTIPEMSQHQASGQAVPTVPSRSPAWTPPAEPLPRNVSFSDLQNVAAAMNEQWYLGPNNALPPSNNALPGSGPVPRPHGSRRASQSHSSEGSAKRRKGISPLTPMGYDGITLPATTTPTPTSSMFPGSAGLSTAAAPGHFSTTPTTPTGFHGDPWAPLGGPSGSQRRSRGQQMRSAPASARNSRPVTPHSPRWSWPPGQHLLLEQAQPPAQPQQQYQQSQPDFGYRFSPPEAQQQAAPQRPPTSHPRVHKVVPNRGTINGMTEVVCLGHGFSKGDRVMFGGFDAIDTAFHSPEALVCFSPPVWSAESLNVTVLTGAQHQAQQCGIAIPPPPESPVPFTYEDAPPPPLPPPSLPPHMNVP